MIPVVTLSGRTDLQCISCDDPALKSAETPLTAPEKSIVLRRRLMASNKSRFFKDDVPNSGARHSGREQSNGSGLLRSF